MPHTIADIAAEISADFTGDGGWVIERLMPPNAADRPHDLALAMSDESERHLASARCAAVIVKTTCQADLSPFNHVLRVADTRTTLARLTAIFAREPALHPSIHPTAIIDPSAHIGENAAIGPFCLIGANSRIGDNARLVAHVTIGADVEIGADALIYPGARIGDRSRLGDRVILQNNVSIGADGFGYATADTDVVAAAQKTGEAIGQQGALMRIGSLGHVEIGDDVEIGANSCIDRATFTVTRIGTGTKIDNLVQIGHNVTIGRDCRICGAAAIAGSAIIGDRAVLGGGSGIADRMQVGDDSLIMASSSVATKVPPQSIYGGIPAIPRNRLIDQIMRIGRLRFLFSDVERLKERVDRIEQAAGDNPSDDKD